jgi:hypothetical protein
MITQLDYGIFDWDDNILHMPTLIKAYDLEKNHFIWLTTDHFAKIRNTAHCYSFDEDAFDLFFDYIPDNFQNDIRRAIQMKTFGPSFEKFKKMVVSGNIIAIVTARGHQYNTLKYGAQFLIDSVLTDAEKIEWYDNLNKYRILNGFTRSDNVNILKKEYWKMCYFHGVSSKNENDEIFQIIRTVEDKKKKQIEEIVHNIISHSIFKPEIPIAIGFSDDDINNLNKVEELFKDLRNIYPNVKFRLYDTSNHSLKKIIIP